MEENGNNKSSKLTAFGYAAGVLSVAAWISAMYWEGPFNISDYILQVLIMAFFVFLFFALGLTPFIVAQKEKGVFEKALTIAGALALNGYLIYYFCLR